MQCQFVNAYMSEKAGMIDCDKKAIAEKIQKITEGTPKSIHEKEMKERRMIQIAEMLKKVMEFTFDQKEQMKNQWKKEIAALRLSRNLTRYWAHLDFDMFYVACELLQKPQLRDKPCAVGGKNSVLCTANYEARKYGVRAALPTFIAVELCPHLVLFEPNFQKYKHFSSIFRKILSQYDSEIQSHGLDEAYIDLTLHVQHLSHSDQQKFIENLRNRIFEQTGLTVSCGLGANKMLAKLASEQRKPNNQYILPNNAEAIENYMSHKSIRKIQGIGPVNQFYLRGLGIDNTIDILQNLDILTICFSKLSVNFFVSASLGLGSIEHEFKERKSVGKSETFKPTDDQSFLLNRVEDLCQQVQMQLQQLGFLSINVVFSYQTINFEKKDKTFNLMKYTDKKQDLLQAVVAFLRTIKNKVRLLGIKCTNLVKAEQHKKKELMHYINNPKKIREQKDEEKNSIDHVKTLMKSDLVEKGKFLCPICSEYIECKGNITRFNKHVDLCLTGEAKQPQQPDIQSSVTQLIKTDTSARKERKKLIQREGKSKEQRIKDIKKFFKKQ